MTHQFWFFWASLAIAFNVGQYVWQFWAIFKNRSGEAVSVVWFASSIGLEVVNMIFGWSRNDSLFVTNAIVCLVGQILVLIALRTYKVFGAREKGVIAAILTVIAAAVVLPFKNTLQVLAQAINLYGGADQPMQLKTARSTGSLALAALLLSGASALIWTAYSWSHFGFWGPGVGNMGYSIYSGYMVWEWCKKAWPAKFL